MADKTDYRQYRDIRDNEPKTDWFNRTALGAMTVVGIGAVAYKMGGPTGKILDKIKERQINEAAYESYRRWSHLGSSDITEIRDLQGKVVYGKGKDTKTIKTSTTGTMEELNASYAKFYGENNLTDVGIINSSARLEADIQAFFEGDMDGHGIDSLKKMEIYRGHTFSPKGEKARMSKDIMVTKLRLETIKEHMRNQYQYADGMPDIDISDPIINEDPYGNKRKVDELHDFYMENDQLYARKYKATLTESTKEFKKITIAKAISDPNMRMKALDDLSNMAFQNNQKLVSKKLGSVDDFIQSFTDVPVTFKSVSTKLYENAEDKYISKDVVERLIDNNLKGDLRLKYAEYMPQITKIAQKLEEVKSFRPKDILEVFIEDADFKLNDRVSRSYINVGIKKRIDHDKDYLVKIPIPIAKDNVVPNINGVRKRVSADVKYIVGNPFRTDDRRVVNSSKRYMEEVHRILSSSTMHDLFDDPNPKQWESKIVSRLGAMQQRESPMVGEARDYFRANQFRILAEEQMFNATTGSTSKKFDDLKVGRQGLAALNRLRRSPKDYMVLTLDLETLNIDAASPQYMPGDPTTGIWQYGMVESDANGKIVNVKEIASDHILRENKYMLEELQQKGALRKTLGEDTTRGARLRKFAEYTKKTMKIDNDYESLVQYMDMVKSKSGNSNKYISSKSTNPIRNTRDFAKLIRMEIKDFKRRAAQAGKKAMIATANGARFDLELLSNILGDPSIKNSSDMIDIQSVAKLMTLGYDDAPAMNVSNLLSHFMNKRGINGSNLISFEHDPWGAIDAISAGKIATVHQSKASTLKDYLQGSLGKKAKAHNSAALDSVATLGVVNLMKDFYQDTDYHMLRDIDEYIQTGQGNDLVTNAKKYMGNEGLRIGDSHLSYGMMSTNAAAKHIMSKVNISHMYPFLGLNKGNTDLHQIARNMFVRINGPKNQRSKWKAMNVLKSYNQVEMEEWMHRNSTDDMNRLANELQFNTVYTIGKMGGQQGLAQLTDDALDFTAVNVKTVALQDIPMESQTGEALTRMYNKIHNKAKQLAKDTGVNFDKDGGEITANIWNEAATQIRRDMEKDGGFPTLDPNNPIKAKIIEGGREVPLKISHPGKIVSLSMDSKPNQNGTGQFLAEIMYEASGRNLAGMATNNLGSKAIVSKLNVKSAQLAGGKFGLLGNPELYMNFDFLQKKYWGSLKHSMMSKAIGIAMWRADPKNGFDIKDRNRARSSIKSIVSKMNENIPTTYVENEGVRFGYKGMSVDPKDIVKQVSNISFDEIFKMASTVGHEYTWNRQTLEQFYGFYGGGDIWKGRTKVRKEIDLMLGVKLKPMKKGMESIMLSTEQQSLVKHLDPLGIIEEDLRAKGALKGGSIENHYKMLGTREQENLITKSRTPILMQVVPDPTLIGGGEGVLGMWAFQSQNTMYGLFQGKENVSNKQIKFQKSYFDQLMIDGNHFSPGFKKTLLGSIGHRKVPKLMHVARKYEKTRQLFQNANLSEILTAGHELSLDEINALVSRTDTRAAIEKDLKRLEANGDNTAVEKINESLDEFTDKIYGAQTPEALEEITARLETMNIKNSEARLRSIRDNDNWYHDKDINLIAKKAKQKDNVWFLPAKIKKSEGATFKEYGERFEFVLEDMIGSLNSQMSHRDRLNPEAYKSMLKVVKEGELYKSLEANKQLFDIVKVKGANGEIKHKVSMAGLLIPADSYSENIAHRIAQGEDYGVLSDAMKMSRDALYQYKKYADLVSEGASEYRRETASKGAALAWIKSWAYGLSTHKNSPYFQAQNTHYVSGFQAMFHTADDAISRAKIILNELDTPNTGMTKWFSDNPSFSRKHVKSVLKNVTDMKLNTVMGLTSTIFDNDRILELASGGGSMTMAQMIQGADNNLKSVINEMKLGRRTMPGGAAFRFPITPNGKNAGFMADFLAVPDEIGQLIGVDANQAYMPEVLANMIKADNDQDTAMVVMRAFSTTEQMNNYASENRQSLKNLLQSGPDTQSFIKDYNESNFINRTYNEKGRLYADVARIDQSLGQIVYEKKPLEDLHWIVDQRDKQVAGALSPLVSQEFANVAAIKNSSQAMEKHLQTISLGAYSKSVIGLWTNTMRTRTHEIFQANPGLAKNSTVLFEMMGDLKHGLAGLSQQSITFAKHGMAEKVYEMADMLKLWQNPGKASVEQYKVGKKFWTDMYAPERQDRAGDVFDLLLNRAEALNIAKKYDPAAARFMKHEAGNLMGQKSFDFASYVEYGMFERGLVDQKLTNSFVNALDSVQGQAIAKFQGESPSYMNSFVDELMGEHMQDPIDRAFAKRHGKMMGKLRPKMKSMGKWGGMAALAYMGLNFFRPNQISNSSNPLDLFNDLGTDINGHTKGISSDLQLPRGQALDMMNASFSKSAFIEMNDINNQQRSIKSRYNNQLLNNSVMHNNRTPYGFKPMGGKTTHTSIKKNFGKFNDYGMERRSRYI